MGKVEREIKLLDVDVKKVLKRLKTEGIKIKDKFIQDVYAFDIPSVDTLYKNYLEALISNNDKRKIKKLITEIKPCFSKDDNDIFEKELGTRDILEFILNDDADYSKLSSSSIYMIMENINERFSKWVRLRKSGNCTTITIKKIVNSKGEYELDAVEELEIDVPDIDTGLELLEDLGYFFARHQLKMRIVYEYKNTEIAIDKWPKLNPYIEVEGPTKEEIDEAVELLDYSINDAVVINTGDLYTKMGIDVRSPEYKDLDFDDTEKKEVDEYMSWE